jgi:Spy/CpxP family protein refolding chaperone
MSYIQSTTGATPAWNTDSNNGPNLRAFANLDLSEAQRKQIRSILQQAQSQGTSPSDVQSQINAVLTTTQQQTLQSDIANLQSQSQSQSPSTSSSSSTAQTPPNPFSGNGPFANLNLTSTQQTQIQQILQSAQKNHTSIDQVNSQIEAVLTDAQKTTFQSDLQTVQTAQGGVSGHRHHHGAGGDA